MSDDRIDLPPAGSPNFNARVREAISTYLGNRGNKLDRGVTLRDLTESGLVSLRAGFLANGGSSPLAGIGPAISDVAVYEADLTPPPTPTGATVTAGLGYIYLSTDKPTFTMGHGYARTLVYGAKTSAASPLFSSAQLVHEFVGQVGSFATEFSTTWHIWMKWESVDGVLSTDPSGLPYGQFATTGLDVSTVLTALTGALTSSQLYSTLGNRIDLIDAPTTGLVAKVSDLTTTYGSTASAAVSASSAATYASSASGSASTASTQAGLATTANTNAGIAAAAASVSQSAAATSASNASGSASAASTQAGLATTANTNAGIAAAAASVSQIASATSESNASGSAVSASSTLTNINSVVAGAASAAVSVESTARIASDTTLFAQYTVKVETNGYVSGFGLASTAVNGTPYSDFIIRADKFSIASPSGPGITPVNPFTVVTTATTLNGVAVPVGIYIDSAYIKSGSITNAMIGTATIDTAKIANLNATLINAGTLDAARISTGSLDAAKITSGTITADRMTVGLMSADNVLTRGLTVRDASGNIILAAGTALAAANITPDGGWLNSAISLSSAGVLSGGSGGTVTIGGLDSTVVRSANPITAGNISTYIASAAIGSAYIGSVNADTITAGTIASNRLDAGIVTAKIANLDAANIANLTITTLKIADNQVTVPLSYTNTSTMGFYNAMVLTGYDGNGDPIYGYIPIVTYTFNMPTACKVIVLWQAETGGTRNTLWSIKLNDVQIGYNRAGGAFQDAPTMISEGTAVAGTNTVKIYWEWGGGTIYSQQLVILGAQK